MEKYLKEEARKCTLGIMTAGFAQKIEWDNVNGELVLTNQRLFVIGEKGHMRKEVVPFLDLDLAKVTAISTAKGLMGKEKLLISLDLGTAKPEKTEFEVKEAASWVASVRAQLGQATKLPQQAEAVTLKQAKYCVNCGGPLPVGVKFCSQCGTAQT